MKNCDCSRFGSWIRAWLVAGSVVAGSLSACGGAKDAPLRSPTLDYPPPPPRESDGRTMGADNIAPGERLEQGAKVGPESKLAPGWEVGEDQPLQYDPKKRKGGATDVEGQAPAKGH